MNNKAIARVLVRLTIRLDQWGSVLPACLRDNKQGPRLNARHWGAGFGLGMSHRYHQSHQGPTRYTPICIIALRPNQLSGQHHYRLQGRKDK